MIEAYEIGIKLALQDGISDGIAAIRRDLGSLDQAIAQTALRLDTLQRIGAQALAASQGRVEQAVSGPLPRRPAAVMVPPSPPGGPETLAAPSPVEVAPVGPTRAPAARVPASPPVPAPSTLMPAGEAGTAPQPVSPRLDVVGAPAVVRPVTPAAEVAQGMTGPKLPEQFPVAPVPRAVLPGEPAGTGSGVVRQVVPELRATGFVAPAGERSQGRVLQPMVPGVAPPAPASRTPVAPQTPMSRTPVAPQAPAEPGSRVARLPQVRTGETRGVRPPRPAAVVDVPATRISPVPGGPAALAPPVPPAASRPAPSYAPPASSSRAKESSMRGDVFLDGARVGRWMSEQMARDAGRPNTGPTGFDPRRSAAWPGAAVTW